MTVDHDITDDSGAVVLRLVREDSGLVSFLLPWLPGVGGMPLATITPDRWGLVVSAMAVRADIVSPEMPVLATITPGFDANGSPVP